MSLKSIVRELKEMRDGIGSMSRRGGSGSDGRAGHGCSGSRHSWPSLWAEQQQPQRQGQGLGQEGPQHQHQHQGRWANLPPELLLDVIQRVESSEATGPARRQVVACAAVCRSWREVTKEVVKTLEECGRITFPISLKQPGPRELPVQCFVRRERATSTYLLYLGLSPSMNVENDKLLLAARKVRRATRTSFVISLVSDDFSHSSSTYVGKLKPNFLGTKFTIFDSQPPPDAVVLPNNKPSKRQSKQVSPRLPLGNYNVATVTYELTVLRNRGPRRMQCTMHSIPAECIQEGGKAPTPTSTIQSLDEPVSTSPSTKGKEVSVEFSSTSLSADLSGPACANETPLVLKNKAPRWHEQLQCWCLNFRGRVTVASVKNFQLVASVDPSLNIPAAEQEKVILQFGKIGKDIFTFDFPSAPVPISLISLRRPLAQRHRTLRGAVEHTGVQRGCRPGAAPSRLFQIQLEGLVLLRIQLEQLIHTFSGSRPPSISLTWFGLRAGPALKLGRAFRTDPCHHSPQYHRLSKVFAAASSSSSHRRRRRLIRFPCYPLPSDLFLLGRQPQRLLVT